ncbi:cell division protein FtsL [Pseudohoeflea coraliihabitans]|uniref:Cell division protein FtsL n=1 Tax=Pseudohoeflea coraliihabitans TaxID=2860393 RepID=A0ABS6WJV5_9HYPH|nr:hypothetical protein [Pseudohoeflea sp. DP4N28-3]MBW3095928.1 hypothetical protein [Pseudohoeflea sp. DP4N28-3]
MLRTHDVLLIFAMIGAATATYHIKHQAEVKLEDVERLQAEIQLEEDTIDLLEADWSLLNQPSRLQRLTADYAEQLQLEVITARQMAPWGELPPAPDPAVAEDASGSDGGVPGLDTMLKTGSVQP